MGINISLTNSTDLMIVAVGPSTALYLLDDDKTVVYEFNDGRGGIINPEKNPEIVAAINDMRKSFNGLEIAIEDYVEQNE